MIRYARTLGLGLALAASIGLLTAGSAIRAADDDDEVKMTKAAGKDVKALATKIDKKYEDLKPLMDAAFKPRDKHGLGVGPKGKGDGIEVKIQSMSKRALSAATLAKQKETLIKMGYINLAIAEVTMLRNVKPKGGKGPKEWKGYTEEMKNASLELIKAVKSGNPAAVKTASLKLEGSCTSCHSDFRD
jgi:dihydroxyacid dehydratase/phosphogluconate dehydratase